MKERIEKCIAQLRLIRIRVEDIPVDGNIISGVINDLIDIGETLDKKPEGGEENVCD